MTIGIKQRAYGMDISRWEPEFNASLATSNLLDFCISKASEGTNWKDPTFESHYLESIKLLANGAYHYLRSGVTGTGLQQANYFSTICANKKLNILAIDFERIGNTMNDSFVIELYNCLNKTTQLAPNGSKVVLYTNPDIYDTIIYPAAIRIWGRDIFLAWELWLAQYPNIVNLDGIPYLPKHRQDWIIWQFSEDGLPKDHGTLDFVDRDIFNGTVAEFSSWLGISSPPAGGSMLEDRFYKVTTNTLNIRSSSENLGATNDLGTFNLLLGDIIHVNEVFIGATSVYHQIDKIWRGGLVLTFPVVSPTGKYWCAEKDGFGTYLVETTNPVTKDEIIKLSYDDTGTLIAITVDGGTWVKQ